MPSCFKVSSAFPTFPVFLAIAMFAGASHAPIAQAQATADVSVHGKIKPSSAACITAAPAGVNYGEIPLEDLNRDGITFLETKKITLHTTCDAATKLAFRITDANPGTALTDAAFLREVRNEVFPKDFLKADNAFGLGMGQPRGKIGAMFLKEGTAKYRPQGLGGIQPSYLINQMIGKWQHNYWNPISHQAHMYAVDQVGRTPDDPAHLPALTKDIWVPLEITVALDTANLSLINPIDLNGKFTYELIYL
jgi:hypothetical protein